MEKPYLEKQTNRKISSLVFRFVFKKHNLGGAEEMTEQLRALAEDSFSVSGTHAGFTITYNSSPGQGAYSLL